MYNSSANKRRVGVYMIYNHISKKSYIGSSSWSIIQRWATHQRDLNNNKHHNIYLQRAWLKYGPNAFQFVILEECGPDQCLVLEQKYIDSIHPPYNICKKAGSRLGVKHSIEVCKQISKMNKGRKRSPEQIESMRKKLLGKKRPYMSSNIRWKRKLGKPIVCNETFQIYHTAIEAAHSLHINADCISKHLKKHPKYKTAGGYTFIYFADVNQDEAV